MMRKYLFPLVLILFFLLPPPLAKGNWAVGVSGTAGLAFQRPASGGDRTSYSRFLHRVDGSRYLFPWLIMGGFYEGFMLGGGFNPNVNKSLYRISIGGLVGFQMGNWLVNLLLGYTTDDNGDGLTAQVEPSYLFPLSANFFLGPKISLRGYNLNAEASEGYYEPGVQMIYLF